MGLGDPEALTAYAAAVTERTEVGKAAHGPATWIVAIAVLVLPAVLGYLAGHWLMASWITPGCERRCADRGSSLRSVVVGHKSGSPPSGCFCVDRATVPWNGPSRAGDLQMAAFVGCYVLLLAVPAAHASMQQWRAARARRHR